MLQLLHSRFASELALSIIKELGQVFFADCAGTFLRWAVKGLPVKAGAGNEQTVAPMPSRASAWFSVIVFSASPDNPVVLLVIARVLQDARDRIGVSFAVAGLTPC